MRSLLSAFWFAAARAFMHVCAAATVHAKPCDRPLAGSRFTVTFRNPTVNAELLQRINPRMLSIKRQFYNKKNYFILLLWYEKGMM
jgi:hypothetical protein